MFKWLFKKTPEPVTEFKIGNTTIKVFDDIRDYIGKTFCGDFYYVTINGKPMAFKADGFDLSDYFPIKSDVGYWIGASKFDKDKPHKHLTPLA